MTTPAQTRETKKKEEQNNKEPQNKQTKQKKLGERVARCGGERTKREINKRKRQEKKKTKTLYNLNKAKLTNILHRHA